MPTTSQYGALFFLSISPEMSPFISVNDAVTCTDQLLGGDLVWMDDARKHNLHCAACVVFFTMRTTVPIQPSITCLWAINTWCHRRAVSCFYKCNGWLRYASRPSRATVLWGWYFWRRNCCLIFIWNKMPAKTSCTLQIYGQIYILGITTKAA